MALEAALSYAMGDGAVIVAAFGNRTVDHVLLLTAALLRTGAMTKVDGDPRQHMCRVGYQPAVSADALPFHTNRISEIRTRGIIFTTLHSAANVMNRVNVNRVIIDETAQARPEQAYIVLENAADFVTSRGANLAVTVVGDHMQSRPISPGRFEVGILSRIASSSSHRMRMLNTTYREPEPIVDLTSRIFYDGRLDAPDEVRQRRLQLRDLPRGWLRNALDPEEPLTLIDCREIESNDGFGFSNPSQAQIVSDLVNAYSTAGINVRDRNRLMVMSTYRAQVIETRRRLESTNFLGVNATSVTRALGSEADVTIFQTVRSNHSGNLGMSGWSEILNVGTSRSRCKLIMIGNLETLDRGQVYEPDRRTSYVSRSREIARFVERHGRIVQPELA